MTQPEFMMNLLNNHEPTTINSRLSFDSVPGIPVP